MDTYTAVPAYERRGLNGLVLIDISRLAYSYGVANDRPVVVTKTSLSGDFSDGWCCYLEEFGTRTTLLKSADTDISPDSENIDLIELLGHGLTVMPQQKLIFACPRRCSGLTYVDLRLAASCS
jgi:hypothetical protein